MSRESPEIVSEIKDFQKIVSFRNIAVHGYDIIEDETVWGIIELHLPSLHGQLESLLKESGGSY
ncbi:MAG: DUF86 domain-containing protein [Nitrospirae bacterium]|nr:DUF86 domain-containing protein [Nitrospirota bacterium]